MDAVGQALETLDLGPNATLQEIKQSYRDLVKVWHPDRYQGNGECFLCKRSFDQRGTLPGNTRFMWLSAAFQSFTGRVHRSLAFRIAR